MLDWNALFSTALVYGLALSVVLLIIMLISGAVALDMWVDDYPPEIRRKYGPMSARARRLRPWIAAAVFLAFLAVPLVGLLSLKTRLGPLPFLPAFAFSAAALLVFNIFDLLVLDWLLFCTVQPRMMVLPGTEGMPAYRDYRFHFIGFLKGLGFCVLGGSITSGALMLIQALQ